MSAFKLLTVYIAVITASQAVVFAQNPLRAAPQQGFANHESQQAAVSQKYRNNSIETIQTGHLTIQPKPLMRAELETLREPAPQIDRNVARAAFTQIPNQTQAAHILDPHPSNILASAIDGQWPSHNRLLDLVMKISLNLVFILSFAVGVMLIAKKWFKPRSNNSSMERAVGDSLCIRETLRIDNRTSIRLIQWRSNRFLVACDHNGIQSVNELNASFDQTLRELDGDSLDEKLLEKLLSGMNSKPS